MVQAASNLTLLLDDGTQTTLTELQNGQPLVLIFLRHFGCVFCRYQVAQLRNRPDLPIVFVCMESSKEAAKFRSKMRSPHRFLSDPERQLYQAFGVARGSATQLVNFRTVSRAIKATLSGTWQGRPTSDPKQLAATVILNTNGSIAYSQLASDAAQITTAAYLDSELARLGENKS